LAGSETVLKATWPDFFGLPPGSRLGVVESCRCKKLSSDGMPPCGNLASRSSPCSLVFPAISFLASLLHAPRPPSNASTTSTSALSASAGNAVRNLAGTAHAFSIVSRQTNGYT
jgi:hypothetical protein